MILIEGYSLALPYDDAAGHHTGPVEIVTADLAQVDIATLVATYSPLLFRVAHSILRSRSEAEDVVQDTFLRVLQHQRKPHPHGDQAPIRDPRVWLIRIAWNLALDRRRRIRPGQMDDLFAASLIDPTLPADRALAESQRMATVLTELDRLPKPERHAILLCALEELSTAEIAAITGRSESAVRALLFRARARLRSRLTPKPSKGARP